MENEIYCRSNYKKWIIENPTKLINVLYNEELSTCDRFDAAEMIGLNLRDNQSATIALIDALQSKLKLVSEGAYHGLMQSMNEYAILKLKELKNNKNIEQNILLYIDDLLDW